MRNKSSAIRRIAIAIRQVWDEANRAEALLLARPWEAEGELRWVREPGGMALVGQDVPVRRSGLGRGGQMLDGQAVPVRRSGQGQRLARLIGVRSLAVRRAKRSARRPRVLRG